MKAQRVRFVVNSWECRHSRTHSTLDTLNTSSLHMTHSTGHLHNNSTFTNSTSHLHITNSMSHLSESLSHMRSTARSRKDETRYIDETRNGHRNAKHIDCIWLSDSLRWLIEFVICRWLVEFVNVELFRGRRDSKWSSECKTKSKSASRNYRSRSLWIRKCCIPMTVSSLVFSGTGCRFTAKWFTQSSHCVCQRVSACVFVFTSLCMSVCECVCICVYIIVFVSVWTDMSLLSLECLW